MGMRPVYWSCTKFADWIRGTPKLECGTSENWQDWRKTSRAQHPIRYWIAEEALERIQDFVNWPMDKVRAARYYINNRFISRSHALTAHPQDIKPGDWHDVGDRFLPCLFNELVDFVEVEQAWHYVMWSEEDMKKYRPAWYRRWFNIRGWRSREAGLAYLDWASSLVMDDTWGFDPSHKDYRKPTAQAEAAKEIKALYLWWTEIYRNRPDLYDVSGWSEICDKISAENDGTPFGDTVDPELKKAKDRAYKLLNKIEKQYEKEENEMLMRLIKIRRHLWT